MRAEDVHPYMDYLFLLTSNYDLLVIDWPGWVDAELSRMEGRIDGWAQALSRNDQLTGVTVSARPDVVELGDR